MSFTLEQIDQLVKRRIETYSKEPSFFRAAYDNEKKLTAEYDGRQLLELLQNCDDANAQFVEIAWDKTNKTLTISNTGTPFTLEGIESLMLANSSPKSGKSFIGNKGLGFRSILNWANKISIYSSGCEIVFSETIAKDVFENKLKISQEQRNEIKAQLNLVDSAIPFPTLAIPSFKSSAPNHWATRIQINYDLYYHEKIEEQLKHLCEEILLFLNSIEQLTIVIDGTVVNEFNCTKPPAEKGDLCQQVVIGDKSWSVFSSGELLLPNELQNSTKLEKEHYNIKIAFQDNLSDAFGKFFNFFPTRQVISLPCLVHATMEINNSRDYFIPESKKNDFIITQFSGLFKVCVESLKQKGLSWNAYKLLTPKNSNSESDEITEIYRLLKGLKNELEIYPSISRSYVSLSELIYYNDEFSRFAQTHLQEKMPEMAIPFDNSDVEIISSNAYDNDKLLRILESLPDSFSIPLRANLIKLLSGTSHIIKASLLVDKAAVIVPSGETCFTPPKQLRHDFEVPSYAKIHLLNMDLYQELNVLFDEELDTKERDRDLVRKINSVVDVRPYDSAAILEMILKRTQTELKTNPDKQAVIKEMVRCLFNNFKNADSEKRKSDTVSESVTLLNERLEPISANSLFLSKTYPKGKHTESIFGEEYNGFYLKDLEFWELNEESTLVEDFFVWLGVNRFVQFEQIKLDKNWAEWDYFKTVSALGELRIPDNFDAGQIDKTSQVRIRNFQKIVDLPLSKIVLLCLLDETIKQQIEITQIEIKWFYNNPKPSTFSNCSYIRYQFIKSGKFSHIILENVVNDLDQIIGGETVEYDYLSDKGFRSLLAKSLLLKLGAKETINNLSPEQLYEILLKVPNSQIKGIQTIYKMVADALESQNAEPIDYPDLRLYAEKNKQSILLPPNEIYYSNNLVLPQKILNNLPILNFPKRAGEEKAAKYFGVQIIKKEKLIIDEDSLSIWEKLDQEFQFRFEILKPFVLIYRLYSRSLKREITTQEARKQAVLSLKKCQIRLVKNCKYRYDSNVLQSLDDYDFISSGDIYYVRVPSFETINLLLKESSFSDAFAEIMSILFEVNELKNDFRFLIRNDIGDTNHLVKHDFNEQQVEYAKSALGVSPIEYNFWQRIFEIEQLEFSESFSSTRQLKAFIEEQLNFVMPSYYGDVNFNSCNNKQTFDFLERLVSSLSVTLKDIYPQGVMPWHFEKATNIRADKEEQFKTVLWAELNRDAVNQSKFLSKIDLFKTTIPSQILPGSIKHTLTPDYEKILSDWVKDCIKIDLGLEVSTRFEETILYPELLQQYSVKVSDIEDDSILSLLYFSGNKARIEGFLKNEIVSNGVEEDDIELEQIDNSKIEIINAELHKSDATDSTNGEQKVAKKKKRSTHSKRTDEQKVKKGKESELLVLSKFQELYGEGRDCVKWVSGYSTTIDRNDNLQHDIQYRNKEGIWVHVEVKTLSNNSFILTASEKKHALEANEKYEFALVDGSNIYRISKPFSFRNGDTFESNSSFKAIPKDYTIRFRLVKPEE